MQQVHVEYLVKANVRDSSNLVQQVYVEYLVKADVRDGLN